MVYAQPLSPSTAASSYASLDDEVPGALWHIYAESDLPALRAFLDKVCKEKWSFNADPVHDQRIYMDRELRERLKHEYGVEGWEVPQYVNQAIFIPAGCAHQVYNYRHCIKV